MTRLCLVILSILISDIAHAAPRWRSEVTIGFVTDGSWQRFELLRETMQSEITELLQADLTVKFPESKRVHADWTLPGTKKAVDKLLKDPQVDLVIALGILTTSHLGTRQSLPKPVIAPVALDPKYQGLPVKDGTSGVRNFSYLVLPLSFDSYLTSFTTVFPVEKATFVVGQETARTLPQLGTMLLQQGKELGLELDMVFVPASATAESIINQIPQDSEAIYLAPIPHIGQEEFDKLVEGLNAKRLPTFSHLGDDDVVRGVLAGFSQAANTQRIGRRVAISVQRIALGDDPGQLPVGFSSGRPRLTINMETARHIGFSPSWKVLSEAKVLNPRRPGKSKQLSLSGAMLDAAEVNLTLLATERSVAAQASQVGSARSSLLPQIQFGAQGVLIDKDRAEASFGSQPQRTGALTVSATQVILSEPLWAGLTASEHVLRSQEEDFRRAKLDIQLEAASRYLSLLKARALERILRDNVTTTRTNLELARLRKNVGISGPAEVNRWITKLAQDQRSVIDASAQRNLAEISLNRLRNRPLEEAFAVDDAIGKGALVKAAHELFALLNNPRGLRIFRRFMVETGLKASPELAALDAAVLAQERRLDSKTREFWVPTVALQGEWSRRVYEDGEGTNGGIPGAAVADDTNWSAAAVLSLPLAEGGGRYYERKEALAQVQQIRFERHALAERIEERIRGSIHRVGAAYPAIELSKQAAGAAKSNLDIITDAYSRGAVSVVEQLDAQNAAFAAEQSEAVTLYDFLLSLAEVTRATGNFSFFTDEGGRGAWLKQLRTYMDESTEVPQ